MYDITEVGFQVWTVGRLGELVLDFVDGIPKCWTKVVVNNVSDLLVRVKGLSFNRHETAANSVELTVGSLFRNLIAHVVLAGECPVDSRGTVVEQDVNWVVPLEAHDVVEMLVHVR